MKIHRKSKRRKNEENLILNGEIFGVRDRMKCADFIKSQPSDNPSIIHLSWAHKKIFFQQ
jgi:hypothetical protein